MLRRAGACPGLAVPGRPVPPCGRGGPTNWDTTRQAQFLMDGEKEEKR
jgi:hypothetical protein